MASKIREWRRELDELVELTGITLDDVCEYIGVQYPEVIGFYHRLPRKRETYIGVGMAFGQSLPRINDWIAEYGNKRRLYAKEAMSDLIWIYLINCSNRQKRGAGINFYRLYDDCQARVQDTYIALWNEYVAHSEGTMTVETGLAEVQYDPMFHDLRAFIAENMDAFKTAYSKPRQMLAEYVKLILDTHTRANDGVETPINFLRGYLDDSMMNYITGDPQIFNVIDMKSRDRVIKTKAVPKLKRTHVALCLALGMCGDEIDEYLSLMGYQPLDSGIGEEKALLQALKRWEEAHPLPRRLKAKYLQKASEENMTIQEELQAVSDMLMLRSDLDEAYRLAGRTFPYLRD